MRKPCLGIKDVVAENGRFENAIVPESILALPVCCRTRFLAPVHKSGRGVHVGGARPHRLLVEAPTQGWRRGAGSVPFETWPPLAHIFIGNSRRVMRGSRLP